LSGELGNQRALSWGVRAHRPLFVAATTALAVAASLVVETPRSMWNWLLLVGAGGLMYATDVFGELEHESQRLAFSSHRPVEQTRFDILEYRAPRHLSVAFAVSLVLVVAAILLR